MTGVARDAVAARCGRISLTNRKRAFSGLPPSSHPYLSDRTLKISLMAAEVSAVSRLAPVAGPHFGAQGAHPAATPTAR